MTRSILSLTVTVAIAALTLAGCGKKEAPERPAAAKARAVTVVRLEPRAITGALSASGELRPREEAAVAAEVMRLSGR